MGKHWVPRKYLAGFASSSEATHIWMYDKKNGSWHHPAISKAVQDPDYFDPETESELATSVEAPAHRVLEKVRKRESISEDEREALAVYIGVMVMRVPRARRRASELVEPSLREVLEKIREQMRSEVSSPEDESLFEDRLKTLERIGRTYADDPPPEVVAKIRSPWPSDEMLGAVRDMAWRFVSTEGPSYFLTSDNPAYFFEGLGLGTPRAELTFPLSSELALLGSWQGQKRSTTSLVAKHALVKEVNRRVASGAERFVFYRGRERWVETITQRSNPYLSRIVW
jgi:hypothetical protein